MTVVCMHTHTPISIFSNLKSTIPYLALVADTRRVAMISAETLSEREHTPDLAKIYGANSENCYVCK